MTDNALAKRLRKWARQLQEWSEDSDEICSIDAQRTVNDLLELATRLDGKEEGE